MTTVSILPMGAPGSASAKQAISDAVARGAGGNQAALQRLAQAYNGPASLVGLAPPKPTPANPTAARTILGVPVVDAVIGAVAVAGAAFLAKRAHWF